MKKILIAAFIFLVSSLTYAQTDNDINYSSQWYLNRGGTWDLNDDRQWNAHRATPIDFSIVMISGIPTIVLQLSI